MVGNWTDRAPRRDSDDTKAISRDVRQRAEGHCEWHRVTQAVPWLPQDSPSCHSYGIAAVCYDDGPPHQWAWLCGRHRTALRQGAG